MLYYDINAMTWQEQMCIIEFINGTQPVQEDPHWMGVTLVAVMLLGMLALFSKAVCQAAAMVRESVRKNGLVETLVICLFVVPLLYVGGTKKGGGGTASGGLSGGKGTTTETAGVRGGGSAGPPRVVFQSAVDGTVFPARFTDAPGTPVQAVMLAAIGDAADLATLIDAPETARIRIVQEGYAEPAMTAMEQSVTAQFTPAQWLVAEVDFGAPVPLGELFFGNTAGPSQWERVWQGEIAEIVAFSAPPGADVRAGVANYLAVKGKFYGHPATSAQRQAAIEAGLNYGLVWGTVIIVK